MAYGKPVKKKKKAIESKERKVKKQTFELDASQKPSYEGPAINRLVADGGWGWGGAVKSTEPISRPTPPPPPRKGKG
tara:strand:- start:446 stop:676 length:231 start_codon:yes stop_codon:yes gene_type:complete